MTQFLAVMFLVWLWVSSTQAQDLPPLPPAPGTDQSQAAPSSSTLPPLPSAPSGTSGASSTALPPLPSAPSGSTSSAPAGAGSGSLPPLPSAPSQASTASGMALPPLPGAAATPASAGSPEAANPSATPSGPKKRKLTPEQRYRADHYRPNVIYGGWVNSKGGAVDARLAWTAQEVLNTAVSLGYTVVKEEGNYEGQPGPPWRQWTFQKPNSDLTPQAYIKPAGKRVWLRVGPSESPAGLTLEEVKAIQREDLRFLKALRKKFGRRLAPHHRGSWEAPYDAVRESADE